MKDFEYNDGVDLEQDLDEVYMARISALGQQRSFRRNEQLYCQGDKAEFVYLLVAGKVKATCNDPFGHETLLKIHAQGSLLGLSALRPNPIRDANGVALEPVKTAMISREEFFAHLRSDGGLSVLLVQLLLKRLQQLHARVSEVAGHRVDQRLARLLLQLSAEVGVRHATQGPAGVSITHEELATMILSRRQTVTTILRSFVLDGLIENRRRRITVMNADGLREIVLGIKPDMDRHRSSRTRRRSRVL